MRRFAIGVLVAVIAIISVSPYAYADRREYTLTGLKHPEAEKPKQGPSERDTEKPYADLIKDRVAIPGLFTFYQDTIANTMYMAIKPDQLNKVYLCGETMSKSEGVFFDNGMLTATYPFYFQRLGKKIMLMEKNLRFRADSTSSFRRAVEAGITDHLLASVKIESKPNDSGAVLIDPSALFVRDVENVNYFLGQAGQTGFSFDRDNSYFEKVKSFPENTEIDVKLHYRTNKPLNAVTMQNPYSMFHTYHYSLSTLPETDYVPRLADDRVGNFLTIYEDYSKFSPETPYVRYVERWNLKKKDPTAALSEPVEPIVYWVENTVPPEYKEWVAKGIEFWNPAFEKIGFKNAIVAKIMPDTASWDPADTRYNVVRWIMRPGAGYAVGPSRANPFTGQIYDADIRVSADFIRYMYNNAANWIRPLSFDGSTPEESSALDSIFPGGPENSEAELSRESAQEAAFGLNYLLASTDNLEQRDSLTKDYIHQYIVQLVAHEVGHTLGLRHNFKASSIYTLDQINDTAFTHKNSTLGTIMDYMPPNVAGRGKVQGDFYPTVPGPYDNWVIAYAYSEFGGKTPQDDTAKLNEIAQRSGDPLLTYGTDEDLGGMDPNRSVDPLCNTFDQGTDVMKYAALRIDQTRELWNVEMKDFEKPGQRYQKILTVFNTGWRPYTEATRWVPKFVGGIYHSRTHIGEPNGKLPFVPVAAVDQKRAVDFLNKYIFAADAFDLPAQLLNKLQPENLEDFEGTAWRMQQFDYPIHQMVLAQQRQALDKLYSPMTVGRLLNDEPLFAPGEPKYTMIDMFTDIRKGIWAEVIKPANVNSFRRQLQLVHLGDLIDIYLSGSRQYPADARSLAANDLDLIESASNRALVTPGLNDMTRAHLKEVLRQIASAKKAQRPYFPGQTLGAGD